MFKSILSLLFIISGINIYCSDQKSQDNKSNIIEGRTCSCQDGSWGMGKLENKKLVCGGCKA